jgi:large-conductance mechanosensitive channel
MKQVNKQNNKKLKNYIINISVLTSTIVLIVAQLYNEYMDKILRDLIAPIVSIDLDLNGEPDLKQLRAFKINIRGSVFPIGNIIYNIFILTIKLLILYYIVKMLINKVKIPLNNKK